MARIGVIKVLQFWLESSKTYHGPINLRFTWPIELTKTYRLVTKYHEFWIINRLGNKRHGFNCRWLAPEDYNADEFSLYVKIFHRGRQMYKYVRNGTKDMEINNKINVVEANVAVPEVIYVHQFSVRWPGDDYTEMSLKVVRTKNVYVKSESTVEPSYWTAVIDCDKWRGSREILKSSPYIQVIREAIRLAE